MTGFTDSDRWYNWIQWSSTSNAKPISNNQVKLNNVKFNQPRRVLTDSSAKAAWSKEDLSEQIAVLTSVPPVASSTSNTAIIESQMDVGYETANEGESFQNSPDWREKSQEEFEPSQPVRTFTDDSARRAWGA
ncbi:uncharacterized protein L201_000142 [Kwoniella dendrophila CBS 6074]|uniref:Uncharacterized protein n=1 Tax=Kwoniella dendrophila CBS 6074 TaxID=1295534 RepID=A0AAX4JL86_9TREE